MAVWCWFWMGDWVSMDQLSHPNRIDPPSNPTSPPIRPEASSNRTRHLDWMGPGVGPFVPPGCNCTRVGHPEGPSLLASRIARVHLDLPDRSHPPRSLTKGVHLVGCVCRVWFGACGKERHSWCACFDVDVRTKRAFGPESARQKEVEAS